jgi:processive 1,2-diacylglycerol beta-glucosyltransferase
MNTSTTPKRRILLAYASIGLGSRRAAESVAAALRREFPDAEVRTADVLDYVNPAARAVVVKGYSSMLAAAPSLWGFLYEKESLADSLAPAENFARSVRWEELRGLLSEFPPEVIAASHPLAIAPFVRLKREGTLELPLVSLQTDYEAHQIDVQEGISLYTSADPRLVDELVRRGAERELVYPCGVPVDDVFAQPKEVAALKAKFGLDPDPAKKVVLVLAKDWSADIADRLLFQLSLLRTPHQLLISSGDNEDLAERLRKYASIYGVQAKLFGLVDNLHEFLAVSDLVVSGGSGLTAAESLASGVPLVILEPVPGQEERNARFLAQSGAARRASGVLTLGAEVDAALAPTVHAQMRQAVSTLTRPNAARDAARAIFLAAQNRQEIARREREARAAKAAPPRPTSPAQRPLLEDIGQERPEVPRQLTREAAKEILTGWIMSEKDAQRRLEEKLAEADRWQRRAEIAARRTEDALAKEALRHARELRAEIDGLELELRRIAAEKAKITGRVTGGPPSTTLGSPDLANAELESRFQSMELEDELERLKRRLERGE